MGGMGKAHARSLRKNPTDAERALWQRIRLRQLEGRKFRRQHPLGRYVVDFVCLDERLIVELDGGQHAGQVPSDSNRTAWLQGEGFRVLRFWNHVVLGDIEAVLEVIRGAVSSSSPPPGPSPAMGGGA